MIPLQQSAEHGTNSGDNPSISNTVQTSSPLNILPGIKPPEILDIQTNPADNWKTYKQIWQNYAIITNLHECTARRIQSRSIFTLHWA